MRLKNVKGAKEAVYNSEYVVNSAEESKGNWSSLFGNDNPISIEIGMGKGKFITTLATMNPKINYIGIEKFESVLIRGVEKQNQLKLTNLLFIRMDAEHIENVFHKDEVEKIYLNFSDPWPKDRHSKRRLTSHQFLSKYSKIMKKDGVVEFKTDNQGLFDFSILEVPVAGWKILSQTKDLHNSELAEGNVMTEYEEKFSSLGNPICKMVICPDFENRISAS